MDQVAFYQPRRRRISLTALIDVVFILLMFFMLTSSFSQWRAVELNAPVQSTSSDDDSLPQLLILGSDNSVHLHGSDFSSSNFSLLSANELSAFDFSKPLVIIPEADAQVQAIVGLLGKLKQLGFNKTTLGDVLPGDKAQP